MKFKNNSTLTIFHIYSIELLIDLAGLQINQYDEPIHKISGEFYYCDLLIEGHLIVNETFFNKFVKKYSMTLKFVKNNCAYIQISDIDIEKLRKEKFQVELVDIENSEPQDEAEEDINNEEKYVFKLTLKK